MKNVLVEVTDGNYDNIGERFFVQVTGRIKEVAEILEENFPNGIECDIIGVYDDDMADLMGYDTI